MEPYHLAHNRVQDRAISYSHLTYQTSGPAVFLTLDRAEQGNLIDLTLAAELRDACWVIRESEAVRVVVITGRGDAFSTGRQPLPEELTGGPLEERQAWIERMQVANDIAGLQVPVVMSINGPALGHGLELALAGDLRICSETACFGFNDLGKPGRFPWDGGTQRLSRLIGPAWALDLLLTSRTVDAKEALEIGLVNRVVPATDLISETRRLADAIAASGPIAARYAKEAVTQGLDLTLEGGLRLEADLNIILQSTKDRAEGLRSFTEKRAPRFIGE